MRINGISKCPRNGDANNAIVSAKNASVLLDAMKSKLDLGRPATVALFVLRFAVAVFRIVPRGVTSFVLFCVWTAYTARTRLASGLVLEGYCPSASSTSLRCECSSLKWYLIKHLNGTGQDATSLVRIVAWTLADLRQISETLRHELTLLCSRSESPAD